MLKITILILIKLLLLIGGAAQAAPPIDSNEVDGFYFILARLMRIDRFYMDANKELGTIVPRRFYRRNLKFEIITHEPGFLKIKYGPRKQPYRYLGIREYKRPWPFPNRHPGSDNELGWELTLIDLETNDTVQHKEAEKRFQMQLHKDYYFNILANVGLYITDGVNILDRRKEIVILLPKKPDLILN